MFIYIDKHKETVRFDRKKRGTTHKKDPKELIFTKLGQLICIFSTVFDWKGSE